MRPQKFRRCRHRCGHRWREWPRHHAWPAPDAETGAAVAAAAEDLEREISEAIQRALSTGNSASTELRAEIAEILKKIDAGGEVLRVALD
jgi:hypothetical protein